MGFRRGEEKKDVRRGFLQGFEQSVKRLGCEHMDFINDVNLETTAAGHIFDVVSKLADLINASIGGAIDFKHVQPDAFCNLLARLTGVAWRWGRTLLTVHGFGHNPCYRSLANAPGAGKKKGVGDSISPDGISQRIRDVILAHDLFKGLWPVSSCKYQIRHKPML
jgi:hypothetical protein